MAKNKRQTTTTDKNSGDNEVRQSYTGPNTPAKVRPIRKIEPKPLPPETKPNNKRESKPNNKRESKPESPKSKN